MNKKAIEGFMEEALLESKKALPKCLPNPPVGCVIVHNGIIVSKGHTQKFGGSHAEAEAFNKIRNLKIDNLDVFVTLEPCSFIGKTASCANLIAESKTTNIYIGLVDSHFMNNGRGIKILKKQVLMLK